MKSFLVGLAILVALGVILYATSSPSRSPSDFPVNTSTSSPASTSSPLSSTSSSVSKIPSSVVPAAHGTVKGVVQLGPTCPVERIPPDPACAPKPYQTTIRIQRNDSNQLYSAQSDPAGAFVISLPPGTYTFTPQGGNSVPPTCRPQQVNVLADQAQTITLDCDTGIR